MKPLSLVLVFCAHMVVAQAVDYNKIILPKNTYGIDTVERLIQIAWQNNPESQISRNNVTISQHNFGRTRAGWLSRISVGANLNEITLDEDNPRNEFYPRYNFGLNLPLGTFVDVPKNTKIALEEVKNANALMNSQKLQIRAEVQRRYELYKLNVVKLNMQTQVAEDALSLFKAAEQQFKNGSLTFEDYNRVSSFHNIEKIKQLSAKTDLNIAKINLEELLGIKWEEIRW